MIIINRALSHLKKERPKKEKAPKNKIKIKNERKREKGQCYYPFFHTCASKQHHDLHDRESLILSHSYTSGNFSLQNLACIFQQWASSDALGHHEQASWIHTHLVSFVELSYIYSSSASVAWQSLLLALTSIDGHLHSPLISRVDVRLSPFLSSPHKLHHHILFQPQCYVHG